MKRGRLRRDGDPRGEGDVGGEGVERGEVNLGGKGDPRRDSSTYTVA
jgi:hypothetical protein